MVREVVVLLPDALLRCPPGPAVGCAAAGSILWSVGARYSRSILTLIAVTAGTLIGMRMPGWYEWKMDGMALAVGGAILLGSCAFLFHRGTIGLLLGGGMMLWAGLGVWVFMAGGMYWDWHNVHWDGDMVQFLHQAWQTLPATLAWVFPAACFVGLAGGITIAVFLPKLAKVLAHSLIGITLMAIMGAVAASAIRPSWLTGVPGSNIGQGMFLVGLVLAGAIVQWQITPPYRSPGSNASRKGLRPPQRTS